jgi:hypothetical protein
MRFLPALLLAACAAPQTGELPSGKELKDPRRLLPVFKEFIRHQEYSKAHGCLSKEAKETLPYEPFYAGLTAYEAVSHLISGLQEHGIDTENGVMRICNPEFGVSRDFRIKGEFGGRLWTLDFTRADLDFLQERALAWFRRQREAAGHRFHVYPRNWPYSKVMPRCGCNRNG